MRIFLKILDRFGQPVFITLAVMSIPIWFPFLVVWVLIDPAYRWAMWRQREVHRRVRCGPTNVASHRVAISETDLN